MLDNRVAKGWEYTKLVWFEKNHFTLVSEKQLKSKIMFNVVSYKSVQTHFSTKLINKASS
jgi:hypothetical protein